MAGVPRLSILVADNDPDVIADYRAILRPPRSTELFDRGGSGPVEDLLFGAALAHEAFPEIALTEAGRPEAAIEAVRGAIEAGSRFTMAFIGADLQADDHGLEAAESIRALDADLPIALVASRCGMHPLDLHDLVPPADRLAILMKPFHAVEIQHLAISFAARGRALAMARAVAAAARRRRAPVWLQDARDVPELQGGPSNGTGASIGSRLRYDPGAAPGTGIPKIPLRRDHSAQSAARLAVESSLASAAATADRRTRKDRAE